MVTHKIQLWDIKTRAGPDHPVSIATWRARYVLNYLSIPHAQRYIELGDTDDEAAKVGLRALAKNPLGEDMYTLPIIYDPSTNKHFMDSLNIARYLEYTYGGPKPALTGSKIGTLFPWSPEAEERFQAEHERDLVGAALIPLLWADIAQLFSPESTAYIRSSRARWHGGKTLEELQVAPSERSSKWEVVRAYLNRKEVSERADGVKAGITYRDAVLASALGWIEKGGKPGEFEAVMAWEGGKWKRFFDGFEKYSSVYN